MRQPTKARRRRKDPAHDIITHRSRVQRLCYACPGLPARSECIHGASQISSYPKRKSKACASKKGRVEPSLSSPSPASDCVDDDPFVDHAPTPQESDRHTERGASTVEDPNNPFVDPVPATLQDPAESADKDSSGVGAPETGFSLHTSNSSSTEDIPDSSSSDDGDIIEENSSPLARLSMVSSKYGSPRANKTNPIYGYVRGAKRGNDQHIVVRTKKAPTLILDRKKSSQRFSRLSNGLLQRCEDLAQETGSWVFFGAQHATAQKQAIVYASERLFQDAGSGADRLASDFTDTVSGLIRARNADALAFQKKLDISEARREQAERELQANIAVVKLYIQAYGPIPQTPTV